MKIKLPIKFADRAIDEFINGIYLNHKALPNDKYLFDLTEVEFIGNQELLVLSALLKSFIVSNIDFEVVFFKKEISTNQINERVKRQIIQFWEVWKIYEIIPDKDFFKYFGIDLNSVQRLQKELNYYPKLSEIYTRHGVTPFVNLDYIFNYNEIEVQKVINPIYKLNSVIEELLTVNKCYHPFTSNSLSSIITEELYVNFLDHSLSSSFKGFQNLAFMSISFQAKIDENKYSFRDIQIRKAINFQTECLNESINFFYNTETKSFKNSSYIQFSFLDFGQGIVETLREQFDKHKSTATINQNDSEILNYAFNYNSSRHPILGDDRNEKYIPRGLFDALTIVRRYNGLLIVRSNYGKILYDFSISGDIEKALVYFGDKKFYFPGTLVSIYIPAIEDYTKINISSIKPELAFSIIKPDNKKYLSINAVAAKLEIGKDLLYGTLLNELRKDICSSGIHSLVFFSFKGCEHIDKRILKKTLYFLLTDYNINHFNNVIILNPPPQYLIEEIELEILMLNDAIKNYKLHPLPLISFYTETEEISVKWLGIYNDEDKVKLNDLLFDQYSLAKSDFNDPSNILGHLNYFDKFGNLLSNFPSKIEIYKYYINENNILTSNVVGELLDKHNSIKKDTGTSLYLCNGNYYQKEYVVLNNLVNDKNDCNTITQLLFDKISKNISTTEQYTFIGITSTSQKILKSFESQGIIKSNDYIALDNYHTFENDLNNELIDINKKYILICDVISTGYLTNRLNEKLKQFGARIEYISVISSTLDSEFETTKNFLKAFEGKIIFLHEYPIKKYKRKDIKDEILSKSIVRINPYTNIPIRLSINETNFNDTIIFNSLIVYNEINNDINISNKFLDAIKQETINVGFYKFNNVIHPYFFNTRLILKDISEEILRDIFSKINKQNLKEEKIQIFFPRKSGIESFDFSKLRKVLNNQSIEEIEIERFGTPEGWRFPHNTDYLSAKISNNICIILDDGTCSGDSIIQMIDEISFYDAKEIVLLCFIGRINDHKREFFSRLSTIKVKESKSIPISIYFACHWHIPTYYIDENPNTKETLWLNELINLKNTPQSIKKISNSIIREITPKDDFNFKDYKYLPGMENGNEKMIPKKELLLVRDEVGKVIGYRLYVESFTFFDCFMKKYETLVKRKDRYKEIELLCAVFIYEPYLWDKITGILPDVVEKIEEFVRVLIFSNQKIYDKLSYKWNKKDIVHLFFIVFKNEKLLKELDEDKFIKLITFTNSKESALNYVLYKLLSYFPINENQLKEKKFDKALKELLFKLKTENSISIKEFKKFYNFISTLPSREDFKSQLDLLIDNYVKQTEPEFHDDKISFNHNVSLIITLLRQSINNIQEEKIIENEKIEVIRERWFEILTFLNPILRFSITFKEFLLPFPYFRMSNKVDSGINSLRALVGFNEDVIFALSESFNDVEKLKSLEKNILRIQSDFNVDSDFCNLISKPQSNLYDLIKTLYNEIKLLPVDVELKNLLLVDSKLKVNIPQKYTEILIIKELTKNIKNHSKNENESKIVLECFCLDNGLFELVITNYIADLAYKNSNGEGIKCLMLLSDSELFGFKYYSKIEETKFIQNLSFKIHSNGYENN